MSKWSKGPTISAPRVVPKEAEYCSLTAVKSYPTASNKGRLVALRRTDSHCLLWSSMGFQFQESFNQRLPRLSGGDGNDHTWRMREKKQRLKLLVGPCLPGYWTSYLLAMKRIQLRSVPEKGAIPDSGGFENSPFAFCSSCVLSQSTHLALGGKVGMPTCQTPLLILSLPALCCFEIFKWVIKEQLHKFDYVMS